jgi:hypothetical protein
MGEIKHDHCFHVTHGQHMIPNHIDVMCCFCGEYACITTQPKYNIGHGEYKEALGPPIDIQVPSLRWPHGNK